MLEIAPVALLIFNRPEKTAVVFDAIRRAQPSILLVVADGPRANMPSDVAKTEACRAIATAVDWPCEVRTDFSSINMGCRDRVRTGLDWVFAQVNRAIILEDDCVPVPAFFVFCTKLLHQFERDLTVSHIGGSNPLPVEAAPLGYFLSDYFFVWGWATWGNRWRECYERDFAGLLRPRSLLCLWRLHRLGMFYWLRIFLKTKFGRLNTWDHQWSYGNWIRNRRSALPSINLVSNIGFDAEATHTRTAVLDFTTTATFQELSADDALPECAADTDFRILFSKRLPPVLQNHSGASS